MTRGVLAGAAAVTLGVAVLMWQPWSGAPDSAIPEPADDGPWFEVFEVPTYAWDGDGGDDALIAGVLAFTDTGCPMLVNPDSPESAPVAVWFPNATGVQYENGVRAVADHDGGIFGIEGQEVNYGGGYHGDSRADEWDALCGGPPLRSSATIYAHAELDPLDEPPPEPTIDLPTRLATDEEQGYFEVPTFEWDLAEAQEGLTEGTLGSMVTARYSTHRTGG